MASRSVHCILGFRGYKEGPATTISAHRLLEALVYLLLPAWAISKIRIEAILCMQFMRHVEWRMGTVLVCLLISERRKLHGENA
mgnify:CR=1 FL=1